MRTSPDESAKCNDYSDWDCDAGEMIGETSGETSMCNFCSVASSSCSICSASIYEACGQRRFSHEECGNVASEAFENDSTFSDCMTTASYSPIQATDPVFCSVIQPEGVEPSHAVMLPTFILQTHQTPELLVKATPNIPSVKATAPARKRRTRKPWTADEEARFTKALDKLAPLEESVMASDIVSGRISVRLPSGVTELLAVIVGTRTTIQVRSHVQKYYLRKIRVMGPGWKCKHAEI